MNAMFYPGEEVVHKDTGDEYIVVAVNPSGFNGWMVTLRCRDGHLTAKRPCNLERISPPPIMDGTVVHMRRLRLAAVNGMRV